MPDFSLKKACFIIPYFGELPNTFPIFLRTCAANPDFDWLIITDDQTEYDHPSNVHYLYYSFEEFVKRVQRNFDFPIALKYPYKICDFRAAFGEIFAEELKEYRFWGHCDLDQYFGKINHFVTDDVLASYDKILCLGHFTLFRNTSYINTLYRTKDRHYGQSYQDAFSDNQHWIFDEWPTAKHTSSNRIFKQEGIKTWLCPNAFCDLQPFQSRFHRTLFDFDTETWTDDTVKSEVFAWEDGMLLRCFAEKGQLHQQEILYVHIRQRKMSKAAYDPGKSGILIVPNSFFSAAHFSTDDVMHALQKANCRAVFRPDECNRKWIVLCSMAKAGFQKIKRLLCSGEKNEK